MFCGECGTQNPDTNQFCKNCGRPLGKKTAAVPGSPSRAAPYMQPVPAPEPAVPAQPLSYYPPAGVQPQAQSYALPAAAAPAVAVKPKHNWIGLFSLILSIVSWMFYPYLLGIAAIALGVFSAYHVKMVTGKIAFLSVAGIVIASGSLFIDFFYFVLFPLDMTDTSFLGLDLLLRFF